MSWYSGLEGICRADVPLSDHTWYGLGGPARWLVTPRSESELASILNRCNAHNLLWRVLGRGANVIVRDEGFDGVVIRLSDPAWAQISFEPPLVTAGAGVELPQLVRKSIAKGLVGLESLAGIPGTVGGAVRMNAGGQHGSIEQYLRQVRIVEPDADVHTRTAGQLRFGYRSSDLGGGIVTAATFALQAGDTDEAMRRFQLIWAEKSRSQPPLGAKSAGCIFKNPSREAAGRLIDRAGLKGKRIGGAEISTRHANFIVAHAGATAQNVIDLIQFAKERVRSETDIALELEVEIW
jgi:UDP-N-acetylmuramate dehydrogenase